MFNEISKFPEFEREFEKLSKKFKTLDEDFQTFIDVQLKLFHKLKQDNRGIVKVSNLGIQYPLIFKVVKFACKALKGRGAKSGIRIIYAYYEEKDTIEFVEIYFKGNKENEDRERILKRYKP